MLHVGYQTLYRAGETFYTRNDASCSKATSNIWLGKHSTAEVMLHVGYQTLYRAGETFYTRNDASCSKATSNIWLGKHSTAEVMLHFGCQPPYRVRETFYDINGTSFQKATSIYGLGNILQQKCCFMLEGNLHIWLGKHSITQVMLHIGCRPPYKA